MLQYASAHWALPLQPPQLNLCCDKLGGKLDSLGQDGGGWEWSDPSRRIRGRDARLLAFHASGQGGALTECLWGCQSERNFVTPTGYLDFVFGDLILVRRTDESLGGAAWAVGR